ncbi:hypothetical protein KEU06_13255 [Pseudaminobacter sp. 19-2017]|uniref:Uncharacterized protein n=1 Tax=Pseudaminobacter soli (ex Zhang et al. 2022) TaxID=2831468 RepID=A0A942I2F0_9HYPH|nr:hypothetical protein [Pseudaminobacter soli]MBS3649577.1 hypothetical protein [Pseudaminobacter soli]
MSDGEIDEWDFAHGGPRSLSAAEIKRFWDGYIARRDDARIEHGSLYSRWRRVADDLVLSLYVANRSVGLFARGQRGEKWATTVSRLSAYEPDLGSALDASLLGFKGCCYLSRLPLPVTDASSWPRGYEWLEERERHYVRVFQDIVVPALT